MVVALGAFPYVRSDGLGSPFHQGGAQIPTVIAALTAVSLAILIGGFGGLGIFVGASILAWLGGKVMVNLLGGLTGDSYGAINETIEAGVIAAAVALLPYGWIEPFPALMGNL